MRDFSRCPRCGAPTIVTTAIDESESKFWRECTKCNTYINTYIPQPHQMLVHKDSHRFIGNFGGYGSGKTQTSIEEVYKHILITPNGSTLIGANNMPQVEQTLKRDFEADFPGALVGSRSTQKNFIDFKNGHRLMYRPFENPDALRSLNITMFVILEASETKPSILTQLKSRLRNLAATKPKVDENGNIIYKKLKNGQFIPEIAVNWARGIIESNPDSGFIRTDVLLISSEIHKHGDVRDHYVVDPAKADPAISSHITDSNMNEYLPPNFIANLSKNRPAWWVLRYIYGSFMYSEGLVYPSAHKAVVETYTVPAFWKRIIAYDYGLSDKSVFLFGAVDEERNKLVIYKEVVTRNKSVEDLASLFIDASSDIPMGGLICAPIIDPKSGPKRDYNKKSLSDHFLDYGIAFQPGQVNIDARIFRLNTYLEAGRVEIMNCCTNLIEELRDYKFKTNPFEETITSDKPEDKNNHSINPLEWIVMELPANPNELRLGIYNKQGVNLMQEKEKAIDVDYYDPFSEDESSYNSGPFGMSYTNQWR